MHSLKYLLLLLYIYAWCCHSIDLYLVLNSRRASCTVPGGRKLRLAVSEARVYEQPVALGTGETFHRCYHLVPEFCTCTYIYATLEFRSLFNLINICKYKYMEYQYMDANLIMYLVRTSSGMHCRPNG